MAFNRAHGIDEKALTGSSENSATKAGQMDQPSLYQLTFH
jgi:hypothetical protein